VKDHVAVIVGNTDGIGAALTRRLLDQGWSVVGVSRRPSELDHPRYEHTVADVTDPDFVPALRRAVRRVDLCVYAAGIGDLVELDRLAEQTRTLDVNLLGLARTVEVVVPSMIAAGSGHLVGLSSLADAAPSGDAPAYGASKAGMSRYLQGLRLALRRHGVAVTTIRFGFVDTKMAKSPVRPAMMTVERAVDVVESVLRTRRAVVSRPRRISALMGLVRLASAVAVRRPVRGT
jgi:NAD(P)-dependent dehydrogenase (short-subunit alcohol dehydrogenase family)